MELRYTLVPDGSSDGAILPVLNWLIQTHLPDADILDQVADPLPAGAGLAARVVEAVDAYPCDLLLVHRDAEGQPSDDRRREIIRACVGISPRPYICVVPVRMSEAWLLTDERAIRAAAGNRNGKVKLEMPAVKQIESLPDPKELLFDLLRNASELTGRRLDKLRPHQLRWNVAMHMSDFAPLRRLTAFAALEAEIEAFVEAWK